MAGLLTALRSNIDALQQLVSASGRQVVVVAQALRGIASAELEAEIVVVDVESAVRRVVEDPVAVLLGSYEFGLPGHAVPIREIADRPREVRTSPWPDHQERLAHRCSRVQPDPSVAGGVHRRRLSWVVCCLLASPMEQSVRTAHDGFSSPLYPTARSRCRAQVRSLEGAVTQVPRFAVRSD